MGCDIHGCIEIQKHDRWRYSTDIGAHVGRSYDTFGVLFGARNSIQANPLFGGRGLPEDVSWQLNDEIDEWGGRENVGAIEFHHPTHCTYDEIEAVEWDQEVDGRDTRYTVLDENKEPTGTKFGWASGWSDIIENNKDALAAGEAIPNEDETYYVTRAKETRKSYLSGAWEWFLFDFMDGIANQYGSENVRLTVWFDN
jgi:hypothetical protein